MRIIRTLLPYLTAAILLMTDGGLTTVRSADDPDDLLNYSFAVWVGSGIYKVSDANKRFAVLRVPAAFTIRPTQYDKANSVIGLASACCCRQL